jgi:hypothetical protein
VLPGGRWPWWAWTLYVALIGPLLLLAAIPAAALRLVMPGLARVWVFERRRAAAGYVVGALAVTLALAGALAFGGARPGPAVTESGAAAGAAGANTGAGPAALPEANQGEASQPTAAPTLPEATTPAAAAAPTAAAGTTGTAGANPAATAAAPTTRRVVVADTGGIGVALRRSARWADRWPGAAWGDGAILVVLEEGISGDDGAGGVAPWLRVRDPASREGFIPARYARPAA